MRSVLLLAATALIAADKPRPNQGVAIGGVEEENISLLIQEVFPPNLVVNVTGQVSSGGWSNVKLTRVVYVAPPKDGIQDYAFTAVPPDGLATQAFVTVKASDTWTGYTKDAPWLKGVRVNGVVKMLK